MPAPSAKMMASVFGRSGDGIDRRSPHEMPNERIPMTREGYDKLRAELDRLQHAEMIEITKRVAAARAMGDLSENAEYHAAREDQALLQARVHDLRDRLSRAMPIDKSTLPHDSVV